MLIVSLLLLCYGIAVSPAIHAWLLRGTGPKHLQNLRACLIVQALASHSAHVIDSSFACSFRREFEYYGPVKDVERDVKARCALVDFDR